MLLLKLLTTVMCEVNIPFFQTVQLRVFRHFLHPAKHLIVKLYKNMISKSLKFEFSADRKIQQYTQSESN